MKPIIVFTPDDNYTKAYDSHQINDARKYAKIWDGTIFRREDWYQEKCEQVRMLIEMIAHWKKQYRRSVLVSIGMFVTVLGLALWLYLLYCRV